MIFNPPPTASWVILKLCKVKDHMSTWITSATYNINIVYKELIGSSTRVSWSKLVWHRTSLSKARFIFWMAMHDELKTKDHLMRIGMTAALFAVWLVSPLLTYFLLTVLVVNALIS